MGFCACVVGLLRCPGKSVCRKASLGSCLEMNMFLIHECSPYCTAGRLQGLQRLIRLSAAIIYIYARHGAEGTQTAEGRLQLGITTSNKKLLTVRCLTTSIKKLLVYWGWVGRELVAATTSVNALLDADTSATRPQKG